MDFCLTFRDDWDDDDPSAFEMDLAMLDKVESDMKGESQDDVIGRLAVLCECTGIILCLLYICV